MTRYRENHDWTMDWTIRAHRKAYWATVIYYYGIKRNQRIFEGDSIVRKTDSILKDGEYNNDNNNSNNINNNSNN